MNRNIIKQVQRLGCRFSIIFVALLICTESASSQTLKKTFREEIAVEKGTEVFTKGPRNIYYEMNGKITSRDMNNEFVIIPGKNDGVPALVISDYKIFTNTSNQVIQQVEIEVIVDDRYPKEATQLMDELAITLEVNPQGQIVVDDNLNIGIFGFTNGTFRKNVNTITLDGGRKYRVKGIRINAQLTVPQTINLTLEADVINASIGDLFGTLNLNVSSGILYAGNATELRANLGFCKAKFGNIKKANVNCRSTKFQADSIDLMVVSSDGDMNTTPMPFYLSDSQLSEYEVGWVDSLVVKKTTTDRFNIGEVRSMTSLYSTFTNYDIDLISESLDLHARNGDLTVHRLGSDFKEVNIANEISSVYINAADAPDYKIELYEENLSEYLFPPNKINIPSKIQNANTWLIGDEREAGDIRIRCRGCKVTIEGQD